MSDDSGETVQVFVRIRPEEVTSSIGQGQGTKCASLLDERTIRLTPPDGTSGLMRKAVSAVDDRLFSFDKIFSEDCSQEDIYKNVSTYVKATVRGYNTTIFAYGSTGSGKSYTMTGTSACPGIIPRAISEIFSIIETTAAQEQDVFFYVRLSYVELYNNNFRNLLEFASKELALKEKENTPDDSNVGDTLNDSRVLKVVPPSQHPGFAQRNEKIEVRESQSAGVFLAGPNLRIPVTTAQEAFQLIARGNRSRATGSTQCNDVSSRSHAILTLHVESRIASQVPVHVSNEGSLSPELRLGKMHLVDLAGSERITLSGAEGETLVETQNINLSLTALGDVLSALSRNAMIMTQQEKGGKSGKLTTALVPVPYRNSKLTHLLKDSLGGNSKTIMLTNIRTLSEYYQQTVVALMYASRAKKVRNRSLVNRNVIGDTGIHAVSSEIERLKSRLDERTLEFERLRLVQLKDAKENMSLKERLQELNAMNETEKKQLETQMSHVIHSQEGQLAAQKEKISSLQNALQNELAVSHNRIAEQEREIKWLKRALEDTAQAAQQPIEKMERMQKVVDAWQSQATNSQQELQAVTSDIEKLKAQNTELKQEISSLKTSKLHLQEALNAKVNEYEQYSNALQEKEYENEKLVRLKESIYAECEDAKQQWRTYAEIAKNSDMINQELKHNAMSLQHELDEHQKSTNSLTEKAVARIKELEKSRNELQNQLYEKQKELNDKQNSNDSLIERATLRINELEQEKSALRNELTETKTTSESLTEGVSTRIKELEQENSDLQNKLIDTVRDLEQRTASAIQGAMTKCQAIDAKCKGEEERASAAESQLQIALHKIESIQLEMTSNDEVVGALKATISELEGVNQELREELGTQEQSLVDRIAVLEASLQTEGETKKAMENEYDALRDEYIIINEKVITLESSLMQKQSSYSILDKANAELRDELKLMTEAQLKASADRDAILKMQNESHLKNLDDMKAAEMHRETKLKEKFNDELSRLQNEIGRKEAEFKEQMALCDTEAQKKANDALQSHIETLEYEHEKLLKQIFNDSKTELESSLLKQKEDLDNYWHNVIVQNETDFENQKEMMIADIKINQQQEKDSLIKSYEALVLEMKESLASIVTKHDEQLAREQLKNSELTTLQVDNEKCINNMKAEHNEYIKNFENDYKKEFEKLLQSQKDHIAKLEAQHQTEINSLSERMNEAECEYQTENNQLKEIYEEKISTLQTMIESIKDLRKEELENLQYQHNNELEKCNDKHNIEIENLKRELSEVTSINDQTLQTNQKHQSLYEEYLQDLETLQKDLQETREKSFNDLNQIQKENQAILGSSLEAAEAKLEQCLQKQSQQLESNYQKELRSLEEKMSQSQQSLMTEARENHLKEVRDLKEEHSKELQDTVSSYERKFQIIQACQDQSKRIELSQLNEVLSIEQVKALEKQRQDLESVHKNYVQQLVIEMKTLHSAEQALLESRRISEVGALQKELHLVVQNHQSSVANLEAQYSTKLERELSDQKSALDTKYKASLSEKQSSIQALHDQISTMQLQHQDDLSHALGGQQERLIDHHRNEVEKLRTELGESEMRHQQELNDNTNQHLQELSHQRQQLDSIHNKVVISLNQEITAAQERYNQAIAAVVSRQTDDAKTLVSQREEFEKVMQSNLNERDAHNKYIIQNMVDNHQLEYKRILSSHENDLAKLQSEYASKERQWKIDAQKAEEALRQQYTQELSAVEISHSEALAEQLSSMKLKHNNEIKALKSEHEALENKYSALNSSVHEQQNEGIAKIAKQQEIHEREVQALLDGAQRELLNCEENYQNNLRIIETKYKDIEIELKNAHEQLIAQLKDDFEAERGQFREEISAATVSLNSEKGKEVVFNEQIKLLKEQIEELHNTFSSQSDASQQLSVALKEQHDKLESANFDYEGLLALSSAERRSFAKAVDEYESRLASSSSEYENLLASSLAEVVSLTKQVVEYESRLSSSSSDYDSLLASLSAERDSLTKQVVEYESRLSSSSSEYESLLASSKAERDTLSKVVDDYESRLSSSKAEFEALLASSEVEYETLVASKQQEHQNELKAIEGSSSDEVNILKKSISALEHQLNNLSEQSESLRNALSNEEELHKAAIEQERKALNDAHLVIMATENDLKAKVEDLNRLQAKNAEEFLLLEAESKKQLEQLQQKLSEQNSRLSDELAIERELNSKYSNAIVQQKEEVINQIELLVRKNHDEIQLFKEEEGKKVKDLEYLNENLLGSIAKKDAVLEEMKVQLSTEKQRRDDETFQLVQQKEEQTRMVQLAEMKFLSIQQKYEEHLTNKDDLLQKKEQQHQTDLQNMKIKFESEKEVALSAIKDQMKQLQKELIEAEGIYSSEWANLRDSIKMEQTKYHTETSSLKQQLSDTHKLLSDMNAAIQQKETDNSNTTAELQQSLRENTRLQLEMNNKEKELRLEIEERLRFQNHEIIQQMMRTVENSKSQLELMKQSRENDMVKIEELQNSQAEHEKVVAAFEELKSSHEQALKDLEASYKDEMKEQIALSQADVQGGHMSQLQQQMDSLMSMVLSQSNSNQAPSIPQDMQHKFMEILQELPDMWRKKHTFVPAGSVGQQAPSTKTSTKQKGGPIYTPVDEAKSSSNGRKINSTQAPTPKHHQPLPWSSPALVSSPTDQLIAAILDGDVQGIRTVVRSKGEGLNSEFWKDLSKSILPLHRAISGLHFHGSERLLVSTIETLSQLGADVNETDHTGNTVLHKAIQVCTSKSVASVVSTLLSRGALCMAKNKDGDTPIHAECKRVRTASVEVLELLIQQGADPNCKSNHNLTPLTQILQRGAASAAAAVGSSFLYGTGYDDNVVDENQDGDAGDVGRTSGRRVWVKAAEFLVRAGAKWDVKWRGTNGCSQIYLLLASFPPATGDFGAYRYLVSTSLEAGLSPGEEDDKGRNGLFALCEQMAGVSTEVCPDSNKILKMILDGCGLVGVGGSDRSGRTVFDIPDRVSFSCLASARPLLVEATMKSASNALDTLDSQNNSILTYESETPSRKYVRTFSAAKSLSQPSSSNYRTKNSFKDNQSNSSSSSSSSLKGEHLQYNNNNNNNNIENIRNVNTNHHHTNRSR